MPRHRRPGSDEPATLFVVPPSNLPNVGYARYECTVPPLPQPPKLAQRNQAVNGGQPTPRGKFQLFPYFRLFQGSDRIVGAPSPVIPINKDFRYNHPRVSQGFGMKLSCPNQEDLGVLSARHQPTHDFKERTFLPVWTARSIAHFQRRSIAKSVCNRHAVSPRSLIAGRVV